jgi:glutamate/tyrosine decarboxylase-like PLP-dependent enzyme
MVRAGFVQKEIGVEPLVRDAANRAVRYLDALRERRVSPCPSALEGLGRFSRPLQDQPLDAAQVLEARPIGSPAAVASAGGRYFGFVVGGSLPAALAANILAAAWDQNAVLEIASPVGAALEKVCRSWIAALLGLPTEAEVGFVTSATLANFTGLAAARHALLQAQGWDVEARGLFGAPPVTAIVGDEVHVSLLKALICLAWGEKEL